MQFSVILPIYNVEKYLSECIDSILCQTYSDFELILVDDGSKDSSGRICDEYAAKDARIKVIHKVNGGQSSARNAGLEAARGEYIVYVDSDDFIVSNEFFYDLHENITATNGDIILYKHVKYFDDTNKFSECAYSLEFASGIYNSDELLYELVKNDSYYGMAWIKSFRRDLAQKNGIIFDTSLSCEDMDWYFNLVLCADTIYSIDMTYIAYRQRAGSVTATIKLKNLVDFVITLEKWSDKIKNADVSDLKRKALMGALAKYYSNLLITYTRLKDSQKKDYKKRIKALSYLLEYGISARPAKMRKVYKLLGFSGVILMLKIYDRIK